MKSYRTSRPHKHMLKHVKEPKQGEPIEIKVERLVNNKEPIKDGAPLIFQERAEGIKQQYNIRTDRFEVAIDAMDKVQKSYKARREERGKTPEGKKDGKPEPAQGKEDTPTEKP